jgi:hypothetical protein
VSIFRVIQGQLDFWTTLRKEAASFSEISVPNYQPAVLHITHLQHFSSLNGHSCSANNDNRLQSCWLKENLIMEKIIAINNSK